LLLRAKALIAMTRLLRIIVGFTEHQRTPEDL
jgi:hypothetical protein